jgi:hypothetical protein
MSVDRILGLGAALLAILVMLVSWGYGLGTPRTPGPGFWPFCIALAMLGLGAMLVIRPAPAAQGEDQSASRWRRLAIALLTLAFYVVALEPLGYLAAMAILLVVQLRWVEDRPWRGSVVIGVASAVASLIVFRTLLKVPLPVGILPLPQGW